MSIERRQVIASSLRDAALRFRFPPNQPICIRDLEYEFSVSSIPLREILIGLANERLIDFVPGKGFFGRRVDPDEIENAFDLLEYFLVDFARYINRSSVYRNSFKNEIDKRATESKNDANNVLNAGDINGLLAGNYRQPHAYYFIQTFEKTLHFVRMEFELGGKPEDMTTAFRKYIELTLTSSLDELGRFVSIYIQERKRGVHEVAQFLAQRSANFLV